MLDRHRHGATGASGALTLDQAAPTARAAVRTAAASVVTIAIPVGRELAGVTVSPLTGTVYTANLGDDTVSVISDC
jgi:DNA-binding beta-propeller fold protein YncE